ncbi:hypothetical protein BCR34DRAFT_566391 [Clohesyomyces aquaticus]|uniref:Short-chain dehydrogenase/reductase n=1 Tax=Clohesyomyces aquaticus TaxID=1231657 RepID=A0A1Y1ZK63_9PLEO|nr:hypothetical protein BCR34DRAFT_566391 [Clohesyomyces aquaticus]
MVSLSEVRSQNASLKSLAPGLVAIFVGGTSGIGLYTAREFVRNTNAPHVYLVGRNQTEATRIIAELQELNPSSQLEFIKSDVSLLKNVDQACNQIKAKESKVNLLFMTVGYLTMKGRDETEEGLDRKFALHYYSRMRFAHNLTPLLHSAANDTDPKSRLARVVSVLDPQVGLKLLPNFADLSLKTTFSLKNCATHASAMNNFAVEHLAAENPDVSGLAFLLKPLSVGNQESGGRHLFAATAPRFAPRKASNVENVATGSDGKSGSGGYMLSWNGEVFGSSKNMDDMRKDGAAGKIWGHTKEVFKKICEDKEKY